MAKINEAGLKIIKKWEKCHRRAYQDPGGVWTIGWGHTGPEVIKGLVWTQSQCDEVLAKDLKRFETCVENSLARPLNSNQFSACVSLAFNIGCSAFKRSTLLKRINRGEENARFEFERFVLGVRDGEKKILPGLVKRRVEEKRLYETLP